MHAMGPIQLIVIAAVVLVLFGKGKVSSLMGEVGKGITAFKKGMTDGQADADKQADTTETDPAVKDVTPVEDKTQG
ncbi:MAG: twin-arginine translocase TatA/TatE family subunit [Cypionkella sp.]